MAAEGLRTSYKGLFIDGSWVDGRGARLTDVVNPATEKVLAHVPEGGTEDVIAAVSAARRAFDEGPWPRMKARARAVVLGEMAEAMLSRHEELVTLNVAEAGSTQVIASFLQVGAPTEHLLDMAERVLPRFDFETPMAPYAKRPLGAGSGVIRHEPVGVAALITPFNFPLLLNVLKVAPALAAGCTAVLKPSPYTPLEALVLGEIANEAGLPPGVLNVVTGDAAAAQELTRNSMVDLVSFTGSDTVGKKVYVQAAESIKRVVLELGGKSANVIFQDADLDRAAASVVQNMTTHCGQGCSLLTRTLVQRSVHDALVSRVCALLAAIKVGDPSDDSVDMGPLISGPQRIQVEQFIEAGNREGATIAYGGRRPPALAEGFFVEPTLFVDVQNSMSIAQREIFGPVGVVIPFDTDADAIALANDSPYGLGGGVWSSDTVRALDTAAQLRTGWVDINGGAPGPNPHGPFGGYKQSGLGREMGAFGLAEYLVDKTITWPISAG